MESITLKRLLAGPISGHHAPEIYCLFKKIEYLDTTGLDSLLTQVRDSEPVLVGHLCIAPSLALDF